LLEKADGIGAVGLNANKGFATELHTA